MKHSNKLAKLCKEITAITSRFYHANDEGKNEIVSKINDNFPDVFCKNIDGNLVSAASELPCHAIVHMSTVHYCIGSNYSLIVIKDRHGTVTDMPSVLDVFPELEWKLNILKMEQALE